MENGKTKIILFRLIAVSAVVLFFVLIELVVRFMFPMPTKNEDLPNIGELSFFSEVSVKGEPSIKITSKYGYSTSNTIFSKHKPANVYRVFVLGGSAAAGWPHPEDERFSTYLDTCLAHIYPNSNIEIINCSAHGFASYRVREVFHQLVQYQPDAVIIWSGNNEFLEDQRFTTSKFQKVVDGLAKRIQTVQVIKNALPKKKLDGNKLNVANSFWKKVQQQSLELCSNPELAQKVRQVYHQSLDEIAGEAAENDIAVVLFTVPVNLRDWQPTVSHFSLKGTDSVRWANNYENGRLAIDTSDYEAAIEHFNKTISMEPLHAMSHFYLAKSLEGLKDTVSALQEYILAKDLDYNPFRAVSDFNKSVREIANSYSNAILFDAEEYLQQAATIGIPGFDLFLDYVHPTREGNMLLASKVAESIGKDDWFNLGISTSKIDTDILASYLSDYRDEDDAQVQVTRYSLCCLTHQYHSAVYFGQKLLIEMPDDYRNNPDNKDDIEKIKDGVKVFSEFLETENLFLKGLVTVDEMAAAKKKMNQFYQGYFSYEAFEEFSSEEVTGLKYLAVVLLQACSYFHNLKQLHFAPKDVACCIVIF